MAVGTGLVRKQHDPSGSEIEVLGAEEVRIEGTKPVKNGQAARLQLQHAVEKRT